MDPWNGLNFIDSVHVVLGAIILGIIILKRSFRLFGNERGTGAEMSPAIVCGIVF